MPNGSWHALDADMSVYTDATGQILGSVRYSQVNRWFYAQTDKLAARYVTREDAQRAVEAACKQALLTTVWNDTEVQPQ